MDMYLIFDIGGDKAKKEMTYQILMLLEMVLIFVSPIIVVVVELYSAEKMLCLQEAGHFLIQCYNHDLSPPLPLSIYIFI